MSPEIVMCFFIEYIAVGVFILLLKYTKVLDKEVNFRVAKWLIVRDSHLVFGSKALLLPVHFQLFPKSDSVFDRRYIREMSCIRNAQTTHAMCMTPFREMFLEGFRAAIPEITAYFAVIIQIETMQLVQPIRYWLDKTRKNDLKVKYCSSIFRLVFYLAIPTKG